MKLTPEAEKIFESEWVVPKKRGLGYKLKPGAPKDVKEEFKKIMMLINAYK